MYDLMYVYVGARSRPPELTVQLVVVYGQNSYRPQQVTLWVCVVHICVGEQLHVRERTFGLRALEAKI